MPLLIFTPGNRAGAADDRVVCHVTVGNNIRLFNIDQRPNDRLLTVIRKELGAHCRQGAGIKLVQQQGFDKVIQMMSQGNLVTIQLGCLSVKNTATQAGTESTIG